MLEAFFTPVQKSITKQYAKASGVLGSELKIYSNKFPSTKNIDIANTLDSGKFNSPSNSSAEFIIKSPHLRSKDKMS